jgi:glucose/arabinose dehydrogenase
VALALTAVGLLLGACAGDNAVTGTTTTRAATTRAATTNTATAVTTATTPATAVTPSTRPPSSAAPTAEPTTAAATPSLDKVKVTLTRIADVAQPVSVVMRPGDDATLYIVEKGGRLRAWRQGALVDTPLLDISGQVSRGTEQGFLDAAFAPDGRHLYVDYTDTNGDSNVDEYAVGADGAVDTASRRRVLFQPQPFANHNGGEVLFGPDGYLYIGLGDGGAAGDPDRNGLDLGTWLAKILRIDPRANGDQAYRVPADNPFVGRADAKPEIWSYGLRNPWRFSFDAATGDLWIGDVGQNEVEEVDRATVASGAGKGVNYGWSAFEGDRRYNDDQPTQGAVAPVYTYTHDDGSCSITGGFVYRGTAVAALVGAYLYADLCQDGPRAIEVAGDGGLSGPIILSDSPSSITGFGEGPGRELFVCSFDGAVFRIDPA